MMGSNGSVSASATNFIGPGSPSPAAASSEVNVSGIVPVAGTIESMWMITNGSPGNRMGLAKTEAEIADRAARFLKAEPKRADVTYEELARRLREHGLNETRDSIAAKLKRGTFAATFFLACLAALEVEGLRLEDL